MRFGLERFCEASLTRRTAEPSSSFPTECPSLPHGALPSARDTGTPDSFSRGWLSPPAVDSSGGSLCVCVAAMQSIKSFHCKGLRVSIHCAHAPHAIQNCPSLNRFREKESHTEPDRSQ